MCREIKKGGGLILLQQATLPSQTLKQKKVDASVTAEQAILMQLNTTASAKVDLSRELYVHKSLVDLKKVPALQGQVC